MPSASDYALRVTAGPKYTDHKPVTVNSDAPVTISTSLADVHLFVRIKDFRTTAQQSSSSNSSSNTSLDSKANHSEYFSHPSRTGARFAISFSATPKKDINGNALLLGNDFDEPVKDYLPPFFGTGLSVVKRFIDPGIEGDPYGDKPYLFGPLLSSANVMRIRSKSGSLDKSSGEPIEEGAVGEDAEKLRETTGMPGVAGQRMKWFLQEDHRKHFVLQKDRTYDFDFYNGYLDFNEFSLKLPMNITFSVIPHLWDQEKIPPLRFVLKDRDSGTVLFHVSFALVKVESGFSSATTLAGQSDPDPQDELD